nr:MAG TPA: hypothetical protein [Caudoviricetes sp.]
MIIFTSIYKIDKFIFTYLCNMYIDVNIVMCYNDINEKRKAASIYEKILCSIRKKRHKETNPKVYEP